MAKREEDIDLLNINNDSHSSRKIPSDELELEEIDLDDLLDDEEVEKKLKKPVKKASSQRVNSKKKNNRPVNRTKNSSKKKMNPVLLWAGRIGATIGATLLILVIFLYSVMAMLVYGPSKTAKIQFVLSVQETSAIGFLANIYCTQEEINTIKEENSIKDTDEVTDAGLVVIDNSVVEDKETPDIEVIDVKGATYNGKLMIVKDPSRLIVGVVPQFTKGDGMVVADIAKRYDAIAGINGGEFVDGADTYTAMPVGLVMKDGEVINSAGTSHVTGITFDNKLVIGNMNAEKAKELNIRDCVSISNSIGPYLVVNGEAQDVSGIAGGLNPRTAIGQTADGKILLLAIDGRQVNSLGASFSDLQDIMVQYGAVNASTMDGGTSTQMVYKGEVINVPYSPTGPRSCPTSFLIK